MASEDGVDDAADLDASQVTRLPGDLRGSSRVLSLLLLSLLGLSCLQRAVHDGARVPPLCFYEVRYDDNTPLWDKVREKSECPQPSCCHDMVFCCKVLPRAGVVVVLSPPTVGGRP